MIYNVCYNVWKKGKTYFIGWSVLGLRMSQTTDLATALRRCWKPEHLEALWIVRLRVAHDALPLNNRAEVDLTDHLEAHATAQVHHARICGQQEHPGGAHSAAHCDAALEHLARYARPAPLARDRLAPPIHDRLQRGLAFWKSEAATHVECSVELRSRSRQRRIEWARREIPIQKKIRKKLYIF